MCRHRHHERYVINSRPHQLKRERSMDWTPVGQLIRDRVTVLSLEILGALVLCIVGRWLIHLVIGAGQRALLKQNIDPTVLRFAASALSVLLNITLVVA